MRKLLAVVVAALTLAGVASAQAVETGPSSAPPPAGPAGTGNAWFADPTNPYAPAGAVATAEWKAPAPLATDAQDSAAPKDLPEGIPAAARVPEPSLPEADGWTFGDGFPRTSGAGRYFKGSYYWSDFIYDDNGAVGAAAPTNESSGAPAFGTYEYPEPAAKGNGADIFRVAVHRKGDVTTWRVDWNTLVDPKLPIAAFTIDSDPVTGVAAWPANAGLTSAGMDWAVVLSGTSARVINLVTGATSPAALTVDTDARSFVVSTKAIPVTGTAVVRVAAGLADDAGTGFRTLDTAHGARPGQPNVYNVAFRDYADESSVNNAWYDTAQTVALTSGGDVSAFSATVDWSKLGAKATEKEPLLPGFTNRWYVSTLDRDQGVASSTGLSTSGPEAYVGRVQPYGIFVPSTYDEKTPTSLTWMLHGALSSHNSVQIHPRFLELACERRRSICVSPLGRGPSGGWRGTAELDFWEVWNRVATAYNLDPDRTILSGVSMGAFGTYKIAMDHPEAFAAAITIVGHANAAEAGLDRLTNLRWMPLYARHGTADELVPITGELQTQDALNAAGLRHVFDYQPAEDHIVVALKDGYDDVAEYMTTIDRREAAPPHINYAWDTPKPEWRRYKLDRPGAWWLDGVQARDTTTRARIDATSFNIPNPSVTPFSHDEPRVLGSPSPTIRRIMEWAYGATPPTHRDVSVDLIDVAALTLDLKQAKVDHGRTTITVHTDGATVLGLEHLNNRTVTLDGTPTTSPLQLTAGTHTIVLAPNRDN